MKKWEIYSATHIYTQWNLHHQLLRRNSISSYPVSASYQVTPKIMRSVGSLASPTLQVWHIVFSKPSKTDKIVSNVSFDLSPTPAIDSGHEKCDPSYCSLLWTYKLSVLLPNPPKPLLISDEWLTIELKRKSERLSHRRRSFYCCRWHWSILCNMGLYESPKDGMM